MATCNLCREHISERDMADGIEQMVEHLRVVHPEEYGTGPERWPDGSIVVDASGVLEPTDFEEMP